MTTSCSKGFNEDIANMVLNDSPDYIRQQYNVQASGSLDANINYIQSQRVLSNYMTYMMTGDSFAKYNFQSSLDDFLRFHGLNAGNEYKNIVNIENSLGNITSQLSDNAEMLGQLENMKEGYRIYSSYAYNYIKDLDKTVKDISGYSKGLLDYIKASKQVEYTNETGPVKAATIGGIDINITKVIEKDGVKWYIGENGTGVKVGTGNGDLPKDWFKGGKSVDPELGNIGYVNNAFKDKIADLTKSVDGSTVLSEAEKLDKKSEIINTYINKIFGNKLEPSLFKNIILNTNLNDITDILIYQKLSSGTVGLETALGLIKKIKFTGKADINANVDILSDIMLNSKNYSEQELLQKLADYNNTKLASDGFDSKLMGAVLYFTDTKPDAKANILARVKANNLGDIRDIKVIQKEIIEGKSEYSLQDKLELLGINKTEIQNQFPSLRMSDNGKVKWDLNHIYEKYIKDTIVAEGNLSTTNIRKSLLSEKRLKGLKDEVSTQIKALSNYDERVVGSFLKNNKTLLSDNTRNIVIKNEYDMPRDKQGQINRTFSEHVFKENEIATNADATILNINANKSFMEQFTSNLQMKSDSLYIAKSNDRYFLSANDFNANFIEDKSGIYFKGKDGNKGAKIENFNYSVAENNVNISTSNGKLAFSMGNNITQSTKLGIINGLNKFLLSNPELNGKALKDMLQYNIGLSSEQANVFIKSLDPETKYVAAQNVINSLGGKLEYQNSTTLYNNLLVQSTDTNVIDRIAKGLIEKGYDIKNIPTSIDINDLFNLKYGNQAQAMENIAKTFGIDGIKTPIKDIGQGLLIEYPDLLPQLNTGIDARKSFVEFIGNNFDNPGIFSNIPDNADFDQIQLFLNGTIRQLGYTNNAEIKSIISYINMLGTNSNFAKFDSKVFKGVLENWFNNAKNISGTGVTLKLPEVEYSLLKNDDTSLKLYKNNFWSEQIDSIGRQSNEWLYDGFIDNPATTYTSVNVSDINSKGKEVIDRIKKLQEEYKSKLNGTYNKASSDTIIQNQFKIDSLKTEVDNLNNELAGLKNSKKDTKSVNKQIDKISIKIDNANADIKNLDKANKNLSKSSDISGTKIYELHNEYNTKIANEWYGFVDDYKDAFPYVSNNSGTTITSLYDKTKLQSITDPSIQGGLIDSINTDRFETILKSIVKKFTDASQDSTMTDKITKMLDKGYTTLFHEGGAVSISIEDGIRSMMKKVDINQIDGLRGLDNYNLDGLSFLDKKNILSKLVQAHYNGMIDGLNSGPVMSLAKFYNNKDLELLAREYGIVETNHIYNNKKYSIQLPQKIINVLGDDKEALLWASRIMNNISTSISQGVTKFDIANIATSLYKGEILGLKDIGKGISKKDLGIAQMIDLFAPYERLGKSNNAIDIFKGLNGDEAILGNIKDVFNEYIDTFDKIINDKSLKTQLMINGGNVDGFATKALFDDAISNTYIHTNGQKPKITPTEEISSIYDNTIILCNN